MRSTLPGLSRVRNSGVPDGGAGALTTCRGRGACAVILSQAAAMAGQEDPVQREIHQDWANREYIEIITSSIKKISDFLNSFAFWTENLSQTHVLGKASIRDFLTQDVQMAPSDRFPLGHFGSTD
ncbi:hypothetical protein U0070_025687 [Myodes glareolus]|uniref:Uncharacterized protein n=1 Tax=Myodes glareolus TaxID=447135 RepID=A0AAW0H790_MYOGA